MRVNVQESPGFIRGEDVNDNPSLTLKDLLEMESKFHETFSIPTRFQHGADMSRATFDELGKSIKMVRPQGEAWLGISTDHFIGIDIHIVNSIPFGVVEECRCKEREANKNALPMA